MQSGSRYRSFAAIMALLLAAVVFPFLAGFYPTVRFPREYIDIHVFPDHIIVEAQYVYKNPFPFPVVQGFYYPLPVDEQHPMPDDVYAEEIEPESKPIPVRFLFGRHLFEKRFRGREESTVLVTYDQNSFDKNGTYIITTTKDWRRPMDYAVYRIFPHGVKIQTSNYKLTKDKDGSLYFERQDFMPAEDWHFSWKSIASKDQGGVL